MNAMKSTFQYSVEFGELKERMSEVPVDKDSSVRWLHALLDKRAAPGDAGVNNVSAGNRHKWLMLLHCVMCA